MVYQVHVYIKGEVIGVGFRAWTKIQAKILQIRGWVRNNFEDTDIVGKGGGVEAVFQGDKDDVEKIVKLVTAGPPISRVDDIQVTHQESAEIFDEFEIRK